MEVEYAANCPRASTIRAFGIRHFAKNFQHVYIEFRELSDVPLQAVPRSYKGSMCSILLSSVGNLPVAEGDS